MNYEAALTLTLGLTYLYAFVGFILFIYFKGNIVIANRQPNIVLFEQLNVYLCCIMTLVPNYNSIGNSLNCRWYQIVTSITSINSLLLLIARMSFIYNYLMKKENLHRFGLNTICKLFWTKNHKLRLNNLLLTIFFWNLVSLCNIFGYDIYTGNYERTFNQCENESVIALTYFNYAMILLFVLYSVQFIRFRIFDQIWMSIELIGFTISLIIAVLIVMIYKNFVYDVWVVYVQTLVIIFFALYFPLFALWRHKVLTSGPQRKSSLLSEHVLTACKKFFCEENAVFLKEYDLYIAGEVNFEYIADTFIRPGAPYQLNVTADLIFEALNCTEDQRRDVMQKIHKEVILVVQQNILPFIGKDQFMI